MIYDLAEYRHTVKPIVKQWCDDKPEEAPIDHIGNLALYMTCPIMIVAYYVGEIYGFTPELNTFIVALDKFYKPEAVLNKEIEYEKRKDS